MSEHYLEDDPVPASVDWALWRRIAGHAAPYRGPLLGLAGTGLLIAVVDTATPLVTAKLIDHAMTNGLSGAIAGWAFGYLALSVVFVACVWALIIFAGRTATGVAYDLRVAGFARLQELSFSYFDVRPVGWIVTRVTSDCTKLSSLMPWFMLDLVWGTFLIAGILVSMLVLSWKLALVVTAIVPLLAVINWVFQRLLLESSRRVRRTNAEITASYNEGIGGARTTKTLVREEAALGEFQVRSTEMYRHSVRNSLQSAVYLPMVFTIGSAGVGLALWRGGLSIDTGGGLTLGTLVAFMQYASLLYLPIQELARRFTELQAAQAAAERVQTLLDTEPEIKDAPHVRAAIERHRGDGAAPDGIAIDGHDDAIGRVEFKGVDFAYSRGESVLDGFDLAVNAGETIALVGPTGGGKSTIAGLVCRFYEPTGGAIVIDGVDYKDRSLEWLQSRLGVVLQSPHLFSGSIRENIRYGRLDATDGEVEDAARAVNAHEFIMASENGYDTEVGEGGGLLSTGQRQLISLARALLADPQIFVLDEATSSIDPETERLIQGGIEAVLEGRVSFVIAHRLSTVQSADRILVIEGGRIVEEGRHAELLGREGAYKALWARQFA